MRTQAEGTRQRASDLLTIEVHYDCIIGAINMFRM